MGSTPSGRKLTLKLRGNAELAEALVSAGLRNPSSIRKTTDQDIINSVGEENLEAVRAVFPRRQVEVIAP